MVPSIMTNISLKSSCILLSMFEGERMGGREIDWGRRKDGKGRRRWDGGGRGFGGVGGREEREMTLAKS